jgi:hypothetical protein
VAHGQQGLERHHGLVIFRKIAGQQQDFFRCHRVVSFEDFPELRDETRPAALPAALD